MYDGKQRTAAQWRAYQKKMEDAVEIKEERRKAGLCDECHKGAFILKIIERQMVRICKSCGKERVV